MSAGKGSGRSRRKFTPEFKAEVVAMVEASGGKIAQVAREMRLHDSSVGNWVREARDDKAGQAPTATGLNRETTTGTPQGGTLSPLLANIALSALDEHFARKCEALGPEWTRAERRRAGEPVMRLVRYADDFVVMVHGTRDDTEALWDEVAAVLAPMGLRLSEAKTRVCHIDEGFDFLGWRIQRRQLARPDRQESGLHLSVQEGTCLRGRQGADTDSQSTTIERLQTCCAG